MSDMIRSEEKKDGFGNSRTTEVNTGTTSTTPGDNDTMMIVDSTTTNNNDDGNLVSSSSETMAAAATAVNTGATALVSDEEGRRRSHHDVAVTTAFPEGNVDACQSQSCAAAVVADDKRAESRDRFLQKLAQLSLENKQQRQQQQRRDGTTMTSLTRYENEDDNMDAVVDLSFSDDDEDDQEGPREGIDRSRCGVPMDEKAYVSSGNQEEEAIRSDGENDGFVSPPESTASMGSVAPTLTAALLPKHYDLTPVMRNTSVGEIGGTGGRCRGAAPFRGGGGAGSAWTTMTDAFAGMGGVTYETIARHESRELSLPGVGGFGDDTGVDAGVLSPEEEQGLLLPPPPLPLGTLGPIPFPPSRKFYTFTSREQYLHDTNQHSHNVDVRDGAEDEDNDEDLLVDEEYISGTDQRLHQHPTTTHLRIGPPLPVSSLTPYQPSREQVLDDYGNLPAEELDRIFIQRRRLSSTQPYRNNDFSVQNRGSRLHRPFGEDVESQKTHRFLLEQQYHQQHQPQNMVDALPGFARAGGGNLPEDDPHRIGRRMSDGSIPSIHMAIPFQSSTMTLQSLTDNGTDGDEEDNSLEVDDDNVSISSLDSTKVHCTSAVAADVMISSNSNAARQKKTKKASRRAAAALEWLATIEADHNVVCEAASSRFLTRGVQSQQQPFSYDHQSRGHGRGHQHQPDQNQHQHYQTRNHAAQHQQHHHTSMHPRRASVSALPDETASF